MLRRMYSYLPLAAAALIAASALSSSASAALVTISSKGSSLDINATSPTGVTNWNVDGVNNLTQMWFWYRIGNNAEKSFDTISSVVSISKAPLSPTFNKVTAIFNDPSFTATYTGTLTGQPAGAHRSSMVDRIEIANKTGSTLDYTFFQYVNLQLAGDILNDVASVGGALQNTATQTDGLSISQTITTPPPTLYQVGIPASFLTLLNDGAASNLSDSGGPTLPSDSAWAFQWNFHIAAHSSVFISETRSLQFTVTTFVPEPASLGILGAFAAMALTRRPVRRVRPIAG